MSSVAFLLTLCALADAPDYVEDRFQIPDGFRIYKVASGELCGGSYDITFDGQGRLLVGDGKQVRRLHYNREKGICDAYEVVATGLGPRGPQGLAVVGDWLWAVGSDGVQVYEGYLNGSGGELAHRRRIGAPFRTGGDHAAHAIFRGHDDFLYFITGDGGGAKDRQHITEGSSPALFERAACVFRISPDGERWECLATGGRNSPNVMVNALGDFFTLDSDMEWHVDLPWWRPVRLNHWIVGGDQGWQRVGAFPPYYIDNLPGIHTVGRGSPNWGVVYEHDALPKKYWESLFVCDYRSKSPTTGGYATNGQLFAIALERRGASWGAELEVFARPKPGATDSAGKRIDFALVDIDVGPDGSLYVSDRTQGVWRIIYDPDGSLTRVSPPPIVPGKVTTLEVKTVEQNLEILLALPQPTAEWSRVERELLHDRIGGEYLPRLASIATDGQAAVDRRLRAFRYLAPHFASLDGEVVDRLVSDLDLKMRGQAAWLVGVRQRADEVFHLLRLMEDPSRFVRRRALQALTRNHPPSAALPRLVDRLEDPDRFVRYTAMVALAHHPRSSWAEDCLSRPGLQTRMRALIAAEIRRESFPASQVRRVVNDLMQRIGPESTKENRLDFLRILGRFRESALEDSYARDVIGRYLLADFPGGDSDVRWEQARLLGEYRVDAAFGALLHELERESDHVTQFHLAQALARLPAAGLDSEHRRAVDWFLSVQTGWFAEFGGKGRQFPRFWATVLTDFGRHHTGALLAALDRVDLASLLGGVVLDLVVSTENASTTLTTLYRERTSAEARQVILRALGRVHAPEVSAFLREEFPQIGDPALHSVLLRSLASQPSLEANRSFLEDGLLNDNTEVVRDCALSLVRFRPSPSQELSQILVSRMVERRDLFRACERLLVAATQSQREGYSADVDPRRNAELDERLVGLGFWKAWYAEKYGEPFEPIDPGVLDEKDSDEVRRFLLSNEARGGNAERGTKVFELLCVSCHGGIAKGERREAIFGPDLTGVTRRLSREELADSLVFPSKLVPERYKASLVQLVDGRSLTGFVTGSSATEVTLATRERVERISRVDIALLAAQDTSLMPEGLLGRLHFDEIRNLLAYLDQIGSAVKEE